MGFPPNIHLAADTGLDSTHLLAEKLRDCKADSSIHIQLEAGQYEFYRDRAAEKFLFISNNDEGLKRIAISLVDRENVTLDGQGALLRTHGALLPIFLGRCRNVVLKNFTLDVATPFHAEATVTAVGDKHIDVKLHEGAPVKLEGGRLFFPVVGSEPWEVANILEFDPVKRETAFKVRDNYNIGRRMVVSEIGPRHFRLTAEFSTPRPQVGNLLALSGFGRLLPGIVISGCTNVRLENITIHQAGGMGVLAQKSEDLILQNVRITPSGDRLISTVADATHFVGCRGHILLEDCVFENQLDDPTNVHGVYTKITGRPSPTSLEVKLNHVQQLGFDFASAGDRVELLRNTSLLTYHEAVVSSVERINKEYMILHFAQPLPLGIEMSDAVGNLTWTPEVTIRGCLSRGNRARGFLISTPGTVLIEDNYFHTPGPAILIAGDANYWFESGAVRDVTIRGNRFENCNYGVWGTGAIEFHPEIEPEHRSGKSYHGNVTIEYNTFIAFDPRLVVGWGVETLTIRGNTYIASDAYPGPENCGNELFVLSNCLHMNIDHPYPSARGSEGEVSESFVKKSA